MNKTASILNRFLESKYFKDLIEKFDPIFVFLGGSRSIGFENSKSDYDLFLVINSNLSIDKMSKLERSDLIDYYFKTTDGNTLHYTTISQDVFFLRGDYRNIYCKWFDKRLSQFKIKYTL